MHIARYWEMGDDGRAHCRLCPHHCTIAEGQAGRCGVRVLRGGALRASTYGMLSAAHNDPIEKKPLYHFYPGSTIFSIGSWGCNLGCRFCQNWGISQHTGKSNRQVTPPEIIAAAKDAAADQPTCAIAYTYNEPVINFEFVFDCAKAAHAAGIKNVLVTNGLINPEPAAELLPLVDALNIDVKSMEETFYRKYCGGPLVPVLNFARQAHKTGCHVEITNLVIPTLNDRPELFTALAQWIRDQLGTATPLHLSAYHPDYQLELPSTPPETLLEAAEICAKALPYVYVGNIISRRHQNTYCPQCGTLQVERTGYHTELRGLTAHGCCVKCSRPADLILPPSVDLSKNS